MNLSSVAKNYGYTKRDLPGAETPFSPTVVAKTGLLPPIAPTLEEYHSDFLDGPTEISPAPMPSIEPYTSSFLSEDTLPSTPQTLSGQSILPMQARVTQEFGQPSQYDVFSGGINYGTDYAVPSGTPVALPQGNYEVLEAYADSPNEGYIGNNTNKGYGNSVLVRDKDTGEMLRFSHLSQVNVRPGETLMGGQIGLSGKSGNVTGQHLDTEYYDANGKIADINRSKYAQSIFPR